MNDGIRLSFVLAFIFFFWAAARTPDGLARRVLNRLSIVGALVSTGFFVVCVVAAIAGHNEWVPEGFFFGYLGWLAISYALYRWTRPRTVSPAVPNPDTADDCKLLVGPQSTPTALRKKGRSDFSHELSPPSE
jgi:CHASE2 domain-containing sensor protein